MPLFGGYVGKPPVVEDEELDPRDGLEQPGVAAIAACERERIEQAGGAMVEHGAIVAAGLVAECAGKPTFAEPGFAEDDQILASGNPIAGGKPCKQRLVEPRECPVRC